MGWIVVLDSGPLGKAAKAPGKEEADRCRSSIAAIVASGAKVLIPEIADYEIRRKLLHEWMKDKAKRKPIERLDQLKRAFGVLPITSDVMLEAARH